MKKINKSIKELLTNLKNNGFVYIARDINNNTVYAYRKKPLFNGFVYYLLDDETQENTLLLYPKHISGYSLLDKIQNLISIPFKRYKLNKLLNHKNIERIDNIIGQ